MKFKSTSSDSRVRSLRLLLALAAPPGWWTDRQVLDPNAAKSDFGSVNQGQLKNMAKKAYAELRNALPSEIWTTPEGQALAALVDSWNPAQTGNLDLINQGQLKAVAKKFYDVLILHGYTNAYPWTGATTAAANDALANLGQLKNLFSFDLTRDSDGDGIPDWQETKFNLNPFNGQTNLTLPQPPSPAQLVIGVPNDWQGWTRIGRSDDPGVYGSGSTSTSALYDVYANQFYLNAASGTSNIPVGNQYVTGDPTGEFTYSPGAFTGEHRILGIGVRGLPGSNVSGFTPTVRFDLGNDSYSAATNVEAGRTSFSLYSHSGDFTVQFQPVAFGASSIYRPSNITFRGDNGYVYTLPGGIGSGASYDFAFRAIPLTLSNSYQMFFDLDAMQSLYSNVSLFQATFNRPNVMVAPGTNYYNQGIGTIGSTVTIALNGLSNNNVVFSVDAPPLPPVEMMVDANRDGEMSFTDAAIHGKDGTTKEKPYRFWLNNDHDIYHTVDGSDLEYDDASDGVMDSNYTSIYTERDLEDFTRLRITFNGITDVIKNTEYSVYLEWRSMDGAQTLPTSDGAPEIRVYQERQPDVRPLYLEDQNAAIRQLAISADLIPYGRWIGGVEPGQPMDLFELRPALRTALSETNPTVNLIFCGKTAGRGQLILTIKKGTRLIEQSPPVYIELLDIKDMYERYTVDTEPSTPQRGGSVPSATAQHTTKRPPTGYTSPGHLRPFAYSTNDPEESKYILYVHGWNMTPMDKEQFAETSYKRLFWQGYKGRFGVFEWPTTHSFEGNLKDALTDSTNYDRGERRAWESAPALRLLLAQLNQSCPGEVHVLGHSMGNVVLGEALRLQSQHGSGQIAKSYGASQGAVSAHCYDATIAQGLPLWTNLQWDYNHPDILNGYNGKPNYGPATPNIYRNWFAFNGSAVGRRINFYNANDYALAPEAWQFNQITKPDLRDLPDQPWNYKYDGDPEQPPSPTGFYKFVDVLLPPTLLNLGDRADVKDRYEIMSFAAEARSMALGGSTGVNGLEQVNLQELWPTDDSPQSLRRHGNYSAHKWHSAQFRSTNMRQKDYWKTLLGNKGFGITTAPSP